LWNSRPELELWIENNNKITTYRLPDVELNYRHIYNKDTNL